MPTEKQQKFLEALFGEAEGDHKLAKEIAGYSENTKAADVLNGLEDEIYERTKKYIASMGPRAAFSIKKVLDDPTDLGNKERLAAAREFLDRAGFKQSDKVEVKAESPLFILPPKE